MSLVIGVIIGSRSRLGLEIVVGVKLILQLYILLNAGASNAFETRRIGSIQGQE